MHLLNRVIFIFFTFFLTQELVAQTCEKDYPQTTPTERFIDQGDGAVKDIQTGLVWKKCMEGKSGGDCSQGTISSFNWEQALQLAESEPDWRLPNIKELLSIVERQCVSPAINLQVFPNNLGPYQLWSSSPVAYYSASAWYVHISSGDNNWTYRNDKQQVRLVRSGQ